METAWWFAYTDARWALTLEQLATLISPDPGVRGIEHLKHALKVRLHDAVLDEEADLWVALETGSKVANEAMLLASDPPPPPDANLEWDLSLLAAADARYQISWLHEYRYQIYNVAFVIATILQERCRCLIFDPLNTRFVLDPDLKSRPPGPGTA